MPLASSAVGDSSWLQNAGYGPVRTRQHVIVTIGWIPMLWVLARGHLQSNAFVWASLGLGLSVMIAYGWAATRVRCSGCGVPVYALWLLGFPKGRERCRFPALACCPYCFDDGTGSTGDATRVDRPQEIRAAIRHALMALLLFFGLMLVVFCLMVKGWFPNY
jgi:hypothetical protein